MSHPPGAQATVPTEQGHAEKSTRGPFGPDFTQTFSNVGGNASREGRPDLGMLDVQRMAAFGRAKGILEVALRRDPVDQDLIDALFVRLIDFALYGADIETILNGLR